MQNIQIKEIAPVLREYAFFLISGRNVKTNERLNIILCSLYRPLFDMYKIQRFFIHSYTSKCIQ